MIKRILVPTDGSEAALRGVRYAAVLAARFNAQIIGLHVIDVKLLEGPFLRDLATGTGTPPFVTYPAGISDMLEARGRTALEGLRAECLGQGIHCETIVETGVIPRIIAEKAELADLIVMGRAGEHSPWLDGLLGSTTEGVVRCSPVPVLVTGEEQPGNGACLAAYDGSGHARHALREAAVVAMEWNMPLRVLAVAEGDSGLLDEARAYLQPHELPVEYESRGGDPAEQIVACAKETNAGLIVMGAFGHSKIRELVLGSTTAQVLNRAHCPVLLVR